MNDLHLHPTFSTSPLKILCCQITSKFRKKLMNALKVLSVETNSPMNNSSIH